MLQKISLGKNSDKIKGTPILEVFVRDQEHNQFKTIGTLITLVAENDGTFTLAPNLRMQNSFDYRIKVLASRANQEEQEQWVRYELPFGKDLGRYTVTKSEFFESICGPLPGDGIIAKILISNGLETEPTDKAFDRMLNGVI